MHPIKWRVYCTPIQYKEFILMNDANQIRKSQPMRQQDLSKEKLGGMILALFFLYCEDLIQRLASYRNFISSLQESSYSLFPRGVTYKWLQYQP